MFVLRNIHMVYAMDMIYRINARNVLQRNKKIYRNEKKQ
jgi:hypothetical protein